MRPGCRIRFRGRVCGRGEGTVEAGVGSGYFVNAGEDVFIRRVFVLIPMRFHRRIGIVHQPYRHGANVADTGVADADGFPVRFNRNIARGLFNPFLPPARFPGPMPHRTFYKPSPEEGGYIEIPVWQNASFLQPAVALPLHHDPPLLGRQMGVSDGQRVNPCRERQIKQVFSRFVQGYLMDNLAGHIAK